jgi:hypothetical protein
MLSFIFDVLWCYALVAVSVALAVVAMVAFVTVRDRLFPPSAGGHPSLLAESARVAGRPSVAARAPLSTNSARAACDGRAHDPSRSS